MPLRRRCAPAAMALARRLWRRSAFSTSRPSRRRHHTRPLHVRRLSQRIAAAYPGRRRPERREPTHCMQMRAGALMTHGEGTGSALQPSRCRAPRPSPRAEGGGVMAISMHSRASSGGYRQGAYHAASSRSSWACQLLRGSRELQCRLRASSASPGIDGGGSVRERWHQIDIVIIGHLRRRDGAITQGSGSISGQQRGRSQAAARRRAQNVMVLGT